MKRLRLLIVTLAVVTLVSARPQGGGVQPTVRTSLRLQLPPMAGVLGDAPLVVIPRVNDGKTVAATSTPIIRSNTAWRLRVTLIASADPTLVVRVATADGRAVVMSGKATTAVVAESADRCARCAVRLDWVFTFSGSANAKSGAPRILPGIAYSAEPRE